VTSTIILKAICHYY